MTWDLSGKEQNRFLLISLCAEALMCVLANCFSVEVENEPTILLTKKQQGLPFFLKVVYFRGLFTPPFPLRPET